MSITHPLRSLRPFALALAALACPALLQAQNAAAAYGPPAPSRFEITAQYAYFHPFTSDINNYQYQTIQGGGLGDIAGYFNKYLGVELEGAAFPEGDNNNNCNYTAQAGPILRYPKGRFVPFFHVLGGAAEVGGPEQQRCTVWGWGVTGGFGLDYVLPGLGNHLALRPIQGDFNYAHIDNGPLIQPAGLYGGLGEIYNYRLSGGLTFRLGTIGQMHGGDTTLTCSADPATSFPGDPVTLTSSVMNLRTKHEPTYLWTSSGGKITGTEATAQLDTTGLAPGTYAVSANLVEGKHQRQIATCSTSFTVRPFEPPTISCSADRAAINSGDPVVITSNARSPQNRPLTYSYNSNSGQITGTGPTAQLSTAGVTPGTININCTVADDKGQSATARTSVVIATPPPPAPAPTASALCSLSFDRDPRRPDRVDNAAKACLDDIALTLNRDANARIVLIGNHGGKETNRDAAARSMNAAQYLTQEKGIDPARIDLRIAADPTRTVNTMLVPAGAPTNSIPGSSFDPSTVVRKGQPYGKPGQPATHKTRTTRHKKHATHHKPASAPTVAQPQYALQSQIAKALNRGPWLLLCRRRLSLSSRRTRGHLHLTTPASLPPHGNDFNFHQRPRSRQRQDLKRRTSRLVWLLPGPEILDVLALHSRKIQFARLRIRPQKNSHLHHVFHIQTLLFQRCLDLRKGTRRLRLRISIIRGRSLRRISCGNRVSQLPAEIESISGPDTGSDRRLICLHMLDYNLSPSHRTNDYQTRNH